MIWSPFCCLGLWCGGGCSHPMRAYVREILEISYACTAAWEVGLSFLRSSREFFSGVGRIWCSFWRRFGGVLVMWYDGRCSDGMWAFVRGVWKSACVPEVGLSFLRFFRGFSGIGNFFGDFGLEVAVLFWKKWEVREHSASVAERQGSLSPGSWFSRFCGHWWRLTFMFIVLSLWWVDMWCQF